MENTYEKNGKKVTINKDLALKIDELLSHGLCSGLGQAEPGKMCVEAAVNYACGFDHGDDPICVGSAVRSFKIGLNDSKWSSNEARAKGMRKIAIGQLGSDKLDQIEFSRKLTFKIITILLPQLLIEVGLEKEAKVCREAKDLDAASDAASDAARAASDAARAASDAASYAARAASYAASYAASDAARAASYAASYAASDAASAASDATSAASDAARAASDAARAASDADKYLIIAADICFEVLKEMNSSGVEFVETI